MQTIATDQPPLINWVAVGITAVILAFIGLVYLSVLLGSWYTWNRKRKSDRKRKVQKDKVKYGIYSMTFIASLKRFADAMNKITAAIGKTTH